MHRHDPAYLLELASRVLGGANAAAQWLDRPSVQLGGRTPRELLADAQGARRIEELLRQIDDEDRLHHAGKADGAAKEGA